VSTIHARKNYDFLLKVWASLYECSEISDVKLVIVGSKSWGGDFITKMLQTDPKLFDRVHHISNLSDKKLDWLYINCIFTVYPSLYEGWGLPITESLSYGKACVASSTSSMPEASQGLGLHVDPTDTIGWTAKIKMLIDDERYRENIEQEIKSKFVFNSWDTIAERIVTNVDLLT
jgi:glycosyltransferase involved in cell wall biosynthesis